MSQNVMERLVDAEVSRYGVIIDEIELICTMTGSRQSLMVHHIGEGFFCSVELETG